MTIKSTKSITREDSIKIEVKDGKVSCTINCLEKDLASVLKTLYEDISKTRIHQGFYYHYPNYWNNFPYTSYTMTNGNANKITLTDTFKGSPDLDSITYTTSDITNVNRETTEAI